MNDCLITKLKSNIQNSDLLSIGDGIFYVYNTDLIMTWNNVNKKIIKILDNGTFSDGTCSMIVTTGSINLSNMIRTDSSKPIKFIIPDKYNLINCYTIGVAVDNLYEIQYGTWSTLRMGANVAGLDISNSNIDCKILANSHNSPYEFVGDVSNFSNLQILTLSKSIDFVTIDVNIAPKIQIISNIEIKNFSSDIIAQKETLSVFNYTLTSNKYFYTFSWPSTTFRDISYCPIILVGVTFDSSDSIDNYLINISNCSGIINYPDSSYATTTINIKCEDGNRTTASDDAVTTLKSSGYTITINDIAQ